MQFSLEGKILFSCILALMPAFLVFAAGSLQGWPWPLTLILALLSSFSIGLWILRRVTKPLNRSLRSLEAGLLNFNDRDFSVSLAVTRQDELGKLASLYNQVGEKLRGERQHLYQRELLLDTVLHSSPMAMVLVAADQHIVYANHEARHLLYRDEAMQGLKLDSVLDLCHPAIAEFLSNGRDGIFTLEIAEENHTYHLSHRQFTLNTQTHDLYLFKQLTREMNRREVDIWKKVLRVISHELNNSLAPISSMAYSGSSLVNATTLVPQTSKQTALTGGMPAQDIARLIRIFDTIEERCQHLSEFVQGYSRFAKLPKPNPVIIDWQRFVEQLQLHCQFTLVSAPPDTPGWGDPAQLEQVLINLLVNAHQAGGEPDAVKLSITASPSGTRIAVMDRGVGMSATVLNQALLPFYSTKKQGSGLGLALCREIIEAHEGRIELRNRGGGGLSVTIFLPGNLQ